MYLKVDRHIQNVEEEAVLFLFREIFFQYVRQFSFVCKIIFLCLVTNTHTYSGTVIFISKLCWDANETGCIEDVIVKFLWPMALTEELETSPGDRVCTSCQDNPRYNTVVCTIHQTLNPSVTSMCKLSEECILTPDIRFECLLSQIGYCKLCRTCEALSRECTVQFCVGFA